MMMKYAAILLLSAAHVVVGQVNRYAVAVITSANNREDEGISGSVTFSQTGREDLSDVTVEVNVIGLPAGEHGFHVHQFGDVTKTGSTLSTYFHFTPQQICQPCFEGGTNTDCQDDTEHAICISDGFQGYPPAQKRHPGDMGNLTSVLDPNTGKTVATKTITLGQGKMSLNDGLRSVIGRSVVFHSKPDDGTQPWGAAGDPIAWGIIGIANPQMMGHSHQNSAVGPSHPPISRLICVFTPHPKEAYIATGEVFISKKDLGDDALLEARIYGLKVGKKSFHFHIYGDMRGSRDYPAAEGGPSVGRTFSNPTGEEIGLSTITVTEAQETAGVLYYSKTFKANNLQRHTGLTITIHSGETPTADPDNTIAEAVCGIANPETQLDHSENPNPPTPTPTPTPTPGTNPADKKGADDSGSSLGGGAVAAIVIVLLLVIVGGGGFAYYMHSTSDDGMNGVWHTMAEEEPATADVGYYQPPLPERGSVGPQADLASAKAEEEEENLDEL